MPLTEKIVPLRDGENLAGALSLIRQSIAVFPLWWPEGERCACGNPSCKDVGKHPIGRLVPNGFKNASKDEATIKRWWAVYPKANVGIATGRVSGIVVVDVDGPKGRAKLAALLSEYGLSLEPRNYVETGRLDGGYHYYFRYPANAHVLSHKDDGLEVKSDGGYVVAPPSQHKSGKRYAWKNIECGPLELLPACFVDFAIQKRTVGLAGESARRNSASSRSRLADRLASTYSPPAWSETEEARVRSALTVIPADDRKFWFEVGAALHSTGWGERARELFDKWSEKSEKYDPAGQEKLWDSFARGYEGRAITLGTLFGLAKNHGWEEPPPFEIAELNKKHFLIRNIGGKCLVGELVRNPIGSGQMLSLQSTDAFKTWYANKRICVEDSNGNKRWRARGAAWLEHPQRRQYERVDLIPNAPKELPNGSLNLWNGFGIEPKKGDWQLMARHVQEVLASGNNKAAEYILRWTAWSLQHPGELAEAALVLKGGKGSGKGVFGNAIVDCFGEHGLHTFYQSHVTGKFNGHLRSCLFLFADEAFWAGDKKGESVLKGLITERTMVIEQKGIDPVQWPNRLKLMMAANAEWVVPASYDERRFAVFEVSNRYAQGAAPDENRKAYFIEVHREIENGGIAAMLHDLMNWDLGNWHPRQVYETEGLRKQKQRSLSPLDQWFVELLQEGKLPGFSFSGGKREFPITRALVNDAGERVPRLHGQLSDQNLAAFLKEWGCIRDRNSQARGWKFPPLRQLRAEWALRYGGWEWDDGDLSDWQ
jgi:Bifunctional DNA primase/polymerase, N-terminal/Primase C terminal 2 (PriCT-2)/Family of unknown function (DUF5906)